MTNDKITHQAMVEWGVVPPSYVKYDLLYKRPHVE